MLWVLLPLAAAQTEPDINWRARQQAWTEVEDTLLFESMEGQLDRSEAALAVMAFGGPDRAAFFFDDPARLEALYWLGRTRWELGDELGARRALSEGTRIPGDRGRYVTLIRDIELEKAAIRTLPVHWTFESTHGFVHPYASEDRGEVSVQVAPTGSNALAWRTRLDQEQRGGDQLEVGMDLPRPPRAFAFKVTTDESNAWLKVKLVDDLGRSWVWPEHLELPPSRTSSVVMRVADFVPPSQDASLAEAGLHRLVLEDVTTLHSDAFGWSGVWIDDFMVE